MAHVTFHSMRLDFQELKKIINTDFERLVFQPMLKDLNNSKEDYILTCYEIYKNKYPVPSIIPFISTNKPEKSKNKVSFGNLPLQRSVIESWIASSPNAIYLDFIPKEDGDYIKYIVDTDPTSKALAAYELKPSPPAS
jgi:hypothetical protein